MCQFLNGETEKGTKSIGGFNPIKDADSTKHGIQRRLL